MYLVSIILQGLVLGTQIVMVALALHLVSAASRICHLAIGAIGAATAYALYGSSAAGWPLWAGILCAVCVAVLLGLCSARMLEPFALRVEPLLGLLVSFGLGLVIESLIAILFGTDGKSLQAGVLPVVHAGNIFLDLPGVITIFLGGALAFCAWVLLRFTSKGRLLRGVAENSALATTLGLNTVLLRRYIYCLSGPHCGHRRESLRVAHSALPSHGLSACHCGFYGVSLRRERRARYHTCFIPCCALPGTHHWFYERLFRKLAAGVRLLYCGPSAWHVAARYFCTIRERSIETV